MNKQDNPVLKRMSHSARYDAVPIEPQIKYARRCPVCNSPMYVVRDDKSYQCKCFNASCGLVVALKGIPGGEPNRLTGANRENARYMGLETLPPTPPWVSDWSTEDPATAFRIETLKRRR